MKKPKIRFAIYAIFVVSYCNAQRISFAYDETGNRVKRELFIVQSTKSIKSHPDSPNSYYDTLSNRTIKITHNSDGIIDIYVLDMEAGDNGLIEIYTLDGAIVLSKEIHEQITNIDIRDMTKGVYLLKVTVNKNPTSWKINKI